MVAVVSVWFTVVHCGSLWFSCIEDNGGRGRARERSWDHLGTNNRDQLGPADQSGRYLKSVIKLQLPVRTALCGKTGKLYCRAQS